MFNGKFAHHTFTGKNLPTIRVRKIVLERFKSVAYGEIKSSATKNYDNGIIGSDIIGIYGQNGSGKTSLIEALSILKQLMSGRRLSDRYADMIKAGSKNCKLEFTLDIQLSDGNKQIFIYEFYLYRVQRESDYSIEKDTVSRYGGNYGVEVRNEKITISGVFNGKNINKQTLIDTSSKDIPFLPKAKYDMFTGKNHELRVSESHYAYVNKNHELNAHLELMMYKEKNRELSGSFIFDVNTLQLFSEMCTEQDYYIALMHAALYANHYLYVVDSRGSGLISLDAGIEFHLWQHDIYGDYVIPVYYEEANRITENMCTIFEDNLVLMNTVLSKIVPGLCIELRRLGPVTLHNDKQGVFFDLMSVRDGIYLPIRYESDGIKKIISVLNLLIGVYNQKSTTVAIDELDAGVFEYLLGEILKIIDMSGQGQLIFTSHNLRPLEVLNYKSIVYTTTNENNRYRRMSIQANNNLRDKYIRSILLGVQGDSLYSETETYEIERAFWKAGRVCQKR